ncbi:hypothetical protein ES703_08309 [subsurface metagenome]
MVGDVIARPFRHRRKAKQSVWGEGHSPPLRLPRRPDFIGTPRNDRGLRLLRPDIIEVRNDRGLRLLRPDIIEVRNDRGLRLLRPDIIEVRNDRGLIQILRYAQNDR